MTEGTLVKVVKGEGLPDLSLAGRVGRVVGSFKGDPIVNLKSRPTLLKGSCWCIPSGCLVVIDENITSKINKIARSDFFSCNIKCVKYVSDEEWYFVLTDKQGDVRSNVLRAKVNYNRFQWR